MLACLVFIFFLSYNLFCCSYTFVAISLPFSNCDHFFFPCYSMLFYRDAFPFPLSPSSLPPLRVASVWISVHMLQIYIQLRRTLEIIMLRKTVFILHSNCVEHMNLPSFCHAVQPLSSCERRCLAQIFQRPTYKFLTVWKCFKEQLLWKKF